MLPGGGISRGETPADAAVREVREETGCRMDAVAVCGVYDAGGARWSNMVGLFEGWRDTVHLFSGITADVPAAGGWEIVEARFWPVDALPPTTSPATRRRIREWQAGGHENVW